VRAGGLDFVPFVLGAARLSSSLAERSPLEGTVFLDVLDAGSAPFFQLLNAGNALAFGDMAMPAWVQLDCATLPTVTSGFALPRAVLPGEVWRRLVAARGERFPQAPGLDDHDGLVPVSEFAAGFSAEAGTVVGFSMFSLLPGLRLGVRSKALGLLLMGARRHVGVTRRDGPERRAQEVFGPLRVLADRPAALPDPGNTIVYEVDVPAPEVLARIVREGRP
jgi:hypothetical protein